MNSMIILGPFSTYKTYGELSAYLWRHIPDTNGDAVALMASLDGYGFSGTAYYGDVRSWQRATLDFSNVPGLGSILNKSDVWVGLWFVTDDDGPTGEGAYVDDVVVRLEPAIHFDISAPHAWSKWEKGTPHDITWRSLGDMGLGGVTIELYRGLTLETTISNVTLNDGTFTWTVPTWVPAASNYQIKVFDTNAPTEWGYSSFFEILEPPSLTLVRPNGGEVWGRGLTAGIHWSSKGYPGQDVRLYLKKGANLSTIISSTPNDGWHAWPIPASQATGTDYKVRIMSVQNTSITDESDGFFSIQEPSLTVTRPWAQQMWVRGNTYDIRWVYVGNPGRTVLIELLRQTSGSLDLDHVIAGGTAASASSRSWTIPADQEPGDNYMIRVTSNTDPFYTDTSEAFSIIAEPSVHLLAPNGGEWLERGTTQTIYWTTELPVGRPIRLRLYRGPGGLIPPFLDTVITSSTEDTGAFDWFIPENQIPDDQYRVQITLATTEVINDWSDDFFRIMGPAVEVMAPGNQDVWLAGTTRTIVWKTTDMPPTDMRIELIRRSTGPLTIADAAPNSGFFSWGIPASIPPETGCRIRITPVVKPSTTGYSYGTFSIAHEAGIYVTSPEPREAWNRGALHMIEWSQIGIPETDVRVELYRGDAFDSLITTAPLYANSCAWRIPESTPVGSDYRIRIVSLWDDSYEAFSESLFAIDPETAVRGSRWPLY
jgi:hypothetical protein